MHNNLRVAGLPLANGKMKIGHKLQFECANGFMLDGQKEVTCLESMQWDAPFPTCSGMFTCISLTLLKKKTPLGFSARPDG